MWAIVGPMLPGTTPLSPNMSVSETGTDLRKSRTPYAISSQEANAKAQRHASSAAKSVGRLNAAENPALIALQSAMLFGGCFAFSCDFLRLDAHRVKPLNEGG